MGSKIVENHHDILFRVGGGHPYLLEKVAYALFLRVLHERYLTLAIQGIKTKGVGSYVGGILLNDWFRERPEPLGIGRDLGWVEVIVFRNSSNFQERSWISR
ncbi:MAG TPA: hypothetical protein VMW40_02310 [Candidatus Bathyarchaeia archaeon]|nr:hypothetical protein [Candidatus Bathyarchaeia archaeon]